MNKNMLLRLASAVVLVPAMVAILIYSSTLYYLLIIIIIGLMLKEWRQMSIGTSYFKYSAVLILPAVALILLRAISLDYKITVFYFFSIWSVDTFAMFGGKTFGGPKLAPVISPNKTWSGLICAAIASAATCYFLGGMLNIKMPIGLAEFGFINALVAQGSDLFVSYFKRRCKVKESGNIIPGHGGVLDRFDSVIFSAPLLLFLLLL